VAFPALRLGGLSLALATLALGFVADNVLFQWSWLSGPLQQGWAIPQPTIGPFHLSDNKTMGVLLAIIVIIVTVLIRNLQRSPSGRMISAVRTSESAAETSGISGPMVKITLFAVSAALAGLGGVLLVTVDQHVTSSTYTTETGLLWLATVVLWGIRRPSAAIAAALSSALFTGILSSGFHFSFISWSGTSSVWLPQVLFGLGAVTMAQNPDGILALTEEQSFRRKQKRAASEVTARASASLVDREPNRSTRPTLATSPKTPARGRVEDPVLRLSSICAAYGETKVVVDIDLDIRRAKLTALVGVNGAGKSTLCKVVAGLMDSSGGGISLNGTDITRVPAHHRTKNLLLAPESRGIFPGLTVEDNLTVLLRSPTERKQAYERFPMLAARRTVAAGDLSGGEQQMLAMAAILVKPPELLIADEPTLGLAPLIVEQMMQLFAGLRAQGVSLLVVEERAKAVLDIADDVALLELGRLVWTGRRADFDPAQLTAIYFGRVNVEDTAPPE
jgi:ABC-type branched-subunit amino acid transport system ATPase component/branched-subunit amino acid ABC-type transport system permease component